MTNIGYEDKMMRSKYAYKCIKCGTVLNDTDGACRSCKTPRGYCGCGNKLEYVQNTVLMICKKCNPNGLLGQYKTEKYASRSIRRKLERRAAKARKKMMDSLVR